MLEPTGSDGKFRVVVVVSDDGLSLADRWMVLVPNNAFVCVGEALGRDRRVEVSAIARRQETRLRALPGDPSLMGISPGTKTHAIILHNLPVNLITRLIYRGLGLYLLTPLPVLVTMASWPSVLE